MQINMKASKSYVCVCVCVLYAGQLVKWLGRSRISITGMLANFPLPTCCHWPAHVVNREAAICLPMSIHILSTSKTLAMPPQYIRLLGVRGPKLTWQGIPELQYPRVDVQAHRLNMPWHQSTPALLPCG